MSPRLAALLLIAGCSFNGPPGASGGDDGDNDAGSVDGPDTTDWLDDSFAARRAIAITNPTRAALDGFPVHVDLSVLAGADVDADGAGLMFARGDAVLAHEVDGADGEGAWVRVDLATGANTIFVYYASTAAPRVEAGDGAAVFDGFSAVYHFADSFGDGDPAADATGNHPLPVDSGLDDADDRIAAQFHTGVELDEGDDERFAITGNQGDFDLADGETILIEAWMLAAAGDDAAPGGLIDLRDNNLGAVIAMSPNGVNGQILGELRNGNLFSIASGIDLRDDAFHHIAYEVDLGAVKTATLTIDGGATRVTVSVTGGSAGGGQLYVGDNFNTNAPFDGVIDEVRVGPGRGPDWIAATARLGIDPTLVVIGDEERIE